MDQLASLATAIGLPMAVYQLRQSRRSLRDNFERTFVERYGQIVSVLELEVLTGKARADLDDLAVRRAFFDYFELCEEELYYRAHRRVSAATWKDWWYGNRMNLRNDSFQRAYLQLVGDAPAEAPNPDRFTYLRGANEGIASGEAVYEPPRPPLRERVR